MPALLAGLIALLSVSAVAATPHVDITVPVDNAKIADQDFPFVVRGTVRQGTSALREWRLSLQRDGANTSSEIATGKAAVVDGDLATLQLGGALRLRPGRRYVLTLQATDAAGLSTEVTISFRIPRLLFARIPLPDRFDEGGYDHVVSSDGTRIALTRVGRNDIGGHPTSVWLFDTVTRELLQFENAADRPTLSADGKFLFFWDLKQQAFPGALYNIDTRQRTRVRHAYFPGVIDAHGTRFTSISSFATRDVPDAGRGVFVLDIASESITRISQGPLPQYVDEVAISSSGPFTAFTSATPFDPTASTGDRRQIFLYDARDGSLRQLTNRTDPSAAAAGPILSADGSRLAHWTDAGQVRVVDLPSGEERFLLDVSEQGDQIGSFFLSDNGQILAFSSTADLDPLVGNETHTLQLFRLNLGTGVFRQVTDATDLSYLSTIDGAAKTFLVEFGGQVRIGSDILRLLSTRVVPRRRRNQVPVLAPLPTTLRSYVGRPTTLSITARDRDGDPITFYAQLDEPVITRLNDFSSDLDDHGNGTAQLTLTPKSTQIGSYRLHVAAFDEVGGVALRTIALSVEPIHAAGDANCDGSVNSEDVSPLLPALLNSQALPPCIASGDINGDGHLTVADLIKLLARGT